MDEHNLKAFNSIINFVNCLYECFGKTSKPLALYNRLLNKTTLKDIEPIQKHVKTFDAFFKQYQPQILSGSPLPANASIKYSDRVHIDLGQLCAKCNNAQTLKTIRQHLLTIEAILHPNDANLLESLKTASQPAPVAISGFQGASQIPSLNLDNSTKEGAFINDVFGNLTESLSSADTSDPMSMLTNFLTSGSLQKMFSGLQEGVESGDMKPEQLMKGVQQAMGGLMQNLMPPPSTSEGETAQTQTSLSGVSEIPDPE